jgi:hypothetical protein
MRQGEKAMTIESEKTIVFDSEDALDRLAATAELLASGTYTIRQKSSDRFVDAHENGEDFALVTRPAQNNDSQRWEFNQVGSVYTIRQRSSGRFVHAPKDAENGFHLVTRQDADNDNQRWVKLSGRQTLQHLANGRFVDTREDPGNDPLVTRPAENDTTQRWIVQAVAGTDSFTVRQNSSGLFVDARQLDGSDFGLFIRSSQENDTQRWLFDKVGGVYTISQKSTGRFVDAHVNEENDFRLVTRTAQDNDTQRWAVSVENGVYTIQQLANGRHADAYQDNAHDFGLVTRLSQDNDTQRWIIKPA